MTKNEQMMLARFYSDLALFSSTNAEEVDNWGRLHVLVGPGRPISPSEVGHLLEIVSLARLDNRDVTTNSLELVGDGAASETNYDLDTVRQHTEHTRDTSAICKPIGLPASNYGQAQWNSYFDVTRLETLKILRPPS